MPFKSSRRLSRHCLSRSANCMLQPLPSSRLWAKEKSRFWPVLGKSCGCGTPACCGLACSWPCSCLPIPSTDEIQVGARRRGHPTVLAVRNIKRVGFLGSPPRSYAQLPGMLASCPQMLQHQLGTGQWSLKTLAQVNKCH